MLSFSGALKVFVALEPVDLRKGFGALEGLVSERLDEDLRQGALFVFSNRRHTRLKILYFDGSGLWLLTKRLEQGIFAWPQNVEERTSGARAPRRGGERALRAPRSARACGGIVSQLSSRPSRRCARSGHRQPVTRGRE